jgi:hypothetical protein
LSAMTLIFRPRPDPSPGPIVPDGWNDVRRAFGAHDTPAGASARRVPILLTL